MKKFCLKKWMLGLAIFVFVTNFPPINTLFGFFIDETHYRYSNIDGSFTFIEFKGHDYEMLRRKHTFFNTQFPQKHDTLIYRVFYKNPMAFWRWGEYFYDKRYKLPYKNWQEIRSIRGYDLKYGTNFQDF